MLRFGKGDRRVRYGEGGRGDRYGGGGRKDNDRDDQGHSDSRGNGRGEAKSDPRAQRSSGLEGRTRTDPANFVRDYPPMQSGNAGDTKSPNSSILCEQSEHDRAPPILTKYDAHLLVPAERFKWLPKLLPEPTYYRNVSTKRADESSTVKAGSSKIIEAPANVGQPIHSEYDDGKIIFGKGYKCPDMKKQAWYIDSKGSQIWICLVCEEEEEEISRDPMIACERCEDWYHFACVGIEAKPPKDTDWYCKRCIFRYLQRKINEQRSTSKMGCQTKKT